MNLCSLKSKINHTSKQGFPSGTTVKNPADSAGDRGEVVLIPGWGEPPGGGHGNSCQYSCLENSMDRGAWRATGVRHDSVIEHTPTDKKTL